MSSLSNSVYSSVFTYNPNVLTRRFRHLTTKASIEPHHITCVTLDISVLIVRFGNQTHAYRPYEPSERTRHPSTSFLANFDKLSDNNASDDRLSLSASVAVNKQISELILMPGNDAILVVYQISTHYNTYACDGTFCHIN